MFTDCIDLDLGCCTTDDTIAKLQLSEDTRNYAEKHDDAEALSNRLHPNLRKRQVSAPLSREQQRSNIRHVQMGADYQMKRPSANEVGATREKIETLRKRQVIHDRELYKLERQAGRMRENSPEKKKNQYAQEVVKRRMSLLRNQEEDYRKWLTERAGARKVATEQQHTVQKTPEKQWQEQQKGQRQIEEEETLHNFVDFLIANSPQRHQDLDTEDRDTEKHDDFLDELLDDKSDKGGELSLQPMTGGNEENRETERKRQRLQQLQQEQRRLELELGVQESSVTAVAPQQRQQLQPSSDGHGLPLVASPSASTSTSIVLPSSQSPHETGFESWVCWHAIPGATMHALPRDACYLLWDETAQGTLYTWWLQGNAAKSGTHLNRIDREALALFTPGRRMKVPAFKYRSGKTEFVRTASGKGGPHVRRYYEGWTMFMKMCRQWNGLFSVREEEATHVSAHLHWGDGRLATLQPGEWYDFGAEQQAYKLGVCATSPYCTQFLGVMQMDLSGFVDKGNQDGAAMLVS